MKVSLALLLVASSIAPGMAQDKVFFAVDYTYANENCQGIPMGTSGVTYVSGQCVNKPVPRLGTQSQRDFCETDGGTWKSSKYTGTNCGGTLKETVGINTGCALNDNVPTTTRCALPKQIYQVADTCKTSFDGKANHYLPGSCNALLGLSLGGEASDSSHRILCQDTNTVVQEIFKGSRDCTGTKQTVVFKKGADGCFSPANGFNADSILFSGGACVNVNQGTGTGGGDNGGGDNGGGDNGGNPGCDLSQCDTTSIGIITNPSQQCPAIQESLDKVVACMKRINCPANLITSFCEDASGLSRICAGIKCNAQLPPPSNSCNMNACKDKLTGISGTCSSVQTAIDSYTTCLTNNKCKSEVPAFCSSLLFFGSACSNLKCDGNQISSSNGGSGDSGNTGNVDGGNNVFLECAAKTQKCISNTLPNPAVTTCPTLLSFIKDAFTCMNAENCFSKDLVLPYCESIRAQFNQCSSIKCSELVSGFQSSSASRAAVSGLFGLFLALSLQ